MTTSSAPQTPDAPNSDSKLWVVFSHLSIIVGLGIFVPLIIYLVKKSDSPFVASHAREALNFHLSVLIYSLICFALVFIVIGVPMLFVLGLASVILAIVAAVKGADGKEYRYPLTIRLVR